MEFYERYEKGPFFSPRCRMCLYRHGVFFFYSGDRETDGDFVLEFLRSSDPEWLCSAGLSRVHFGLNEFGECVREAVYAALVNDGAQARYHRYDDIGIYKALFPFAGHAESSAFSEGVTGKIKEYDIENGSELLETLDRFVTSGMSIHETSEALGVHENTLRYRLEKIASITGLSFRSHDDAEQLSLAVKLSICAKLLARL